VGLKLLEIIDRAVFARFWNLARDGGLFEEL
jgi:hypothetical protein